MESKKKESHFFATLSRMKYIERWALMRNAREETLSEHSLDVAVIMLSVSWPIAVTAIMSMPRERPWSVSTMTRPRLLPGICPRRSSTEMSRS